MSRKVILNEESLVIELDVERKLYIFSVFYEGHFIDEYMLPIDSIGTYTS